MSRCILYSFRRCPYAIRARIALISQGIDFELREVNLRQKPTDMLALSPKGTVPVLVLPDGRVIDESLDILDYVLGDATDPQTESLIQTLTEQFIPTLHRYKYADRYDDVDRNQEQHKLLAYMQMLDDLLKGGDYLSGDAMGKADMAILPFIRQLHRADEEWFYQIKFNELQRWYQAFYHSPLHAQVMHKQDPYTP